MVNRSDLRARLTVRGGYDVPLQGPASALRPTNGILFPFTPNISVAHQVEYSQYDLVHTNYQQNAFNKTRTPTIQVTGMFASQTPDEALYTYGVMHFLRVVSKMNFGINDPDAGTPPPLLSFTAYGAGNFDNIPVLVGGFNFIYEDGVDYVEIEGADGPAQIPATMVIAMDLLPQYNPSRQTAFDLNLFANGSLYQGGFI